MCAKTFMVIHLITTNLETTDKNRPHGHVQGDRLSCGGISAQGKAIALGQQEPQGKDNDGPPLLSVSRVPGTVLGL